MFTVGFIIFFVTLGYFTGVHFEKKHYASLLRREKELLHIPVVTHDKDEIGLDKEVQLFGGSVVIASDYFKSFVAGFRNIFGGRISVFETLLDRGRREALLRMKQQAADWNAEKIVNFRLETSSIGATGGEKAMPCVELFAYGTAVRSKKMLNESIRS